MGVAYYFRSRLIGNLTKTQFLRRFRRFYYSLKGILSATPLPQNRLNTTLEKRFGDLVIESKRILLKPEFRKELFQRLLERYNAKTFQELAKVLKVSRSCIKKWRRGDRYAPPQLFGGLLKPEMILNLREKQARPIGYHKLPMDVWNFIYSSETSYSTIAKEVKRMFGRIVSKSTISYVKRGSPFRSSLYNNSGRCHDVSKLTDWERGYITGFFAGDGSTTTSPHRVLRFHLNKLKEYHLARLWDKKLTILPGHGDSFEVT